MKKLFGILLVTFAVLTLCFDYRSPDGIGADTWISSSICIVTGAALLFLTNSKNKGGSSNWDLDDLAYAVEDKEVSLPPVIKSIFKNLYATLDEIADEINSGNLESATDAISDIQSSIERALYPKGPTEKQAMALSRRRRKRKPNTSPTNRHKRN
jgi:hypothetical protein